jgi:hypothetical protein
MEVKTQRRPRHGISAHVAVLIMGGCGEYIPGNSPEHVRILPIRAACCLETEYYDHTKCKRV